MRVFNVRMGLFGAQNWLRPKISMNKFPRFDQYPFTWIDASSQVDQLNIEKTLELRHWYLGKLGMPLVNLSSMMAPKSGMSKRSLFAIRRKFVPLLLITTLKRSGTGKSQRKANLWPEGPFSRSWIIGDWCSVTQRNQSVKNCTDARVAESFWSTFGAALHPQRQFLKDWKLPPPESQVP
jgi:hypothetical protein